MLVLEAMQKLLLEIVFAKSVQLDRMHLLAQHTALTVRQLRIQAVQHVCVVLAHLDHRLGHAYLAALVSSRLKTATKAAVHAHQDPFHLQGQ